MSHFNLDLVSEDDEDESY